MRVALLVESPLPHMNGVTGSVFQVLRQLERVGHQTLVVSPGAGRGAAAAPASAGRFALLPSVPLPSYPEVRVATAGTGRVTALLRDFGADVVHLASPFVLGWRGIAAADALRIPAVAVYQTDVVAYAECYGLPGAAPVAAAHTARLHRRATMTLAPSAAAERQLAGLGVDRVRRWGRGVDAERFAPSRRSERWRDGIAAGELLVGYAGRLAPEKQVADLRVLCDIPGVRLVVIGDGPERERLRRELPGAVFTGFLDGDALAEAVAGLDVFVHPGESETFCQTIQEAHASGVPVVATGRGGPRDLVRSSVDGWLYRPGDLGELRGRVLDLVGDDAKRRAFALAARRGVLARSWPAVCAELIGHYADAVQLRRIDDTAPARGAVRAELPRGDRPRIGVRSYVALGDSLTEGLCDASRMPDGRYRGWADRLAMLLAQDGDGPFRYANLAVRSRRVADLVGEQGPAALALRPDLVSILMGANDLVGRRADPAALAREIEAVVRGLRGRGVTVLLVTPFLPRRSAAALFARRFAAFASQLRRIAGETGALLLDADAIPQLGAAEMWADDRVHLSSRGHRLLAYRAAELLGVRDARRLAGLDAALHDGEDAAEQPWLRRHALPWLWRRLRGRTAGDGLRAKHEGYVTLPGGGARRGATAP